MESLLCPIATLGSLESPSRPLAQVPELQENKETLNRTKNKLNDKDKTVWHQHTRFTNPAGNIMRTVRRELSAELLTQAWAKFYEMAARVVPTTGPFASVHICEAPGGFICALNHYLRSNREQVEADAWEWWGMTLNPYYEGNSSKQMVDDDLFISKTYDRWFFGSDNTGNVMIRDNIAALKVRVTSECSRPVMLVTADGSIDCQDNPNEQERTVAHLHYCEAVTALTLLSPGGNFLLKGFTLFEDATLCLTYMLCCLFKKVSVVKPLTSKSGNSETYTLCRGFQGITSEQLEMLQSYHSLTASEFSLFSLSDIPEEFLSQFKVCSKQFMSYQRNMIENNIRTFENLPHEEKKELYQTKDYAVEHYKLVAGGLAPIPSEHRLVTDIYLDGTKLNTTAILSSDGRKGSNRRKLEESHSEQIENAAKSWFDRVVAPQIPFSTTPSTEGEGASVGDKLLAKMGYTPGQGLGREGTGISEAIEVTQRTEGVGLGYESNPVNTAVVRAPDQVSWFTSPTPSKLTVRPVYGGTVDRVTNSRFVSVETLDQLNEAEINATVTHLPDLPSLARSVHPYYAVASVADLYDPSHVQLAELDRLTGVVTGVPGERTCPPGSSAALERWGFTEDPSGQCSLVVWESGGAAALEGLRVVVEGLVEGGNAVLHCSSLTDRLTVGIVYLLTCLFQRTTLLKTQFCCPHTPDLYVVCKGKIAGSGGSTLREALSRTRAEVEALEKGRQLLELVPVSLLFQSKFYKFVSCVSERACDDAVHTTVQLEGMRARNQWPSGKSNRFIMDCTSLMQAL